MTALQVNDHINQHHYELPEPEVVVKRIIDHEKLEHQQEILEMEKENSPFLELCKRDDSYWEKQSELYMQIERIIRKNPDIIPTWEVASPLHYGMTLSKMKTVIEQKFHEMVCSGKIMRESSLKETHDRSMFYPENGKGSNNLTRIWGANFLKSNLREAPTLDAAEHYLIVGDEETEIEVQVWHNNYPVLSTVKNAHVLSQKIAGERAAWNYRSSVELDRVKYRDFQDPGNIIRDSNGVGWVVDTEHKSFEAPKLNRTRYRISEYLRKRFEVLTGDDYYCLFQTFKISLSDIGLK